MRTGLVLLLVALSVSCGASNVPQTGAQEPESSVKTARDTSEDENPLQPMPDGESATAACDLDEGYEIPEESPVTELSSKHFSKALDELTDWSQACGNSYGAGKVELEFTVGKDGRPIVIKPVGELAGTLLAKCAADLGCLLKLPPFEEESTFTYTMSIWPTTR